MPKPRFNNYTGTWENQTPETKELARRLLPPSDVDPKKQHFLLVVDQELRQLNHYQPTPTLGRAQAAVMGCWYDEGIELDFVLRRLEEWDSTARRTVGSPRYFDDMIREAWHQRQLLRAPEFELLEKKGD